VLVPPVSLALTPPAPAVQHETADELLPPARLGRAHSATADADELLPPARLGPAHPGASDDDGIDSSTIAGLGGLALIAVVCAGSSLRIRVRSARPAMA
jgi:hypothetical protein